jgi:hypothetical protein
VGLTNKPQVLNKPSYLVTFEGNSKGKVKKIITIEKPDVASSHVQVKGIFTELDEEDAQLSYQDILTSAPKETIVELMIPWQRIFQIRSLVFKAK